MILLVGGAGYIGSHTFKMLHKSHDVVIYDNLSTGHIDFVGNAIFEKGDIRNSLGLDRIFKKYPISTVIHFAAKAYVGESVIMPAIYYDNNVSGTLSLLNCMKENSVKNIIFSSSCATYGIPCKIPITEDTPQNPINPYGMTKYMVEKILADYKNAYDFNFVALRYFNVAGATEDCDIGEWHEPETHAIPLLLDSISKGYSFKVYGNDYPTNDGTCIRDYIHVDDLAEAHVRAIDYLSQKNYLNYINLGTGVGASVLELIESARRITDKKVIAEGIDRREGDPPVLIASYERAKSELGWIPKRSSIDNIIKSAWNWHRKLMVLNEQK